MMSVTKRHNVLKVLGALVLSVVVTGKALAEAPSFSGFVDFGYNYNFNGMTTNTLRTFDGKANSFTLQNAEIAAEGKNGDYGYRVDLNYGKDASVTNYLNKNAGDELDIQQAFITAPCPWTGGTVTFGKFVTMHGAEVIEAKDNYNTSRGFLFNYAIPLTHTGIKYDKSIGDLALTAGVTNGWDNMYDNNEGKSFHAMASKPFGSKVKATVGGTYGAEQATATPSVEKNGRALVDAIVSVNPTEKLSFVANYDWGVEEGLVPAGTDTNQNWSGLAAYANYMWSDKFSTALRWETFDDEGSRTGTEQVLNSVTLTAQCKDEGGIIKRFELRQDGSSDKVFTDKDALPDDSQTTLSFQVILPF